MLRLKTSVRITAWSRSARRAIENKIIEKVVCNKMKFVSLSLKVVGLSVTARKVIF